LPNRELQSWAAGPTVTSVAVVVFLRLIFFALHDTFFLHIQLLLASGHRTETPRSLLEVSAFLSAQKESNLHGRNTCLGTVVA
jgi:hypothetical protein